MRSGRGASPGKRGVEIVHTNKFEHGPEFQMLRLMDTPGVLYHKDKVIKVDDRKGQPLKFRLIDNVIIPAEGEIEVLTRIIP